MQACKAQHFFDAKQVETERVERRLTREREDEEMISLLRNYGMAAEAPLTNEMMASALRTWKKDLPHLHLTIGKICRADLIAKIRAFTSSNPMVQVPDDGANESEGPLSPPQMVASGPPPSVRPALLEPSFVPLPSPPALVPSPLPLASTPLSAGLAFAGVGEGLRFGPHF
jgi:hypothetical protein